MRFNHIAVLAAITFMVSISSVFAQSSNTQTNFTISPPPLGYPEFPEESKASQTVDGTFAHISGDNFSMVGVFLGWTPRFGGDWGAIQGMFGFFSLNGEIDTGFGKESLTFIGMDLAPALEMPIVNGESFKFILFGGYDLTITHTSFTTTNPYGSGTLIWTLTTGVYGPLLGFQMHIKLAETLLFSPFIMVKSMQGSTDISTDPYYYGLQSSYDIPTTTYITYGFDIILDTESGVALSGLINMASETKDTKGYKSYMFGMSFKL